MPGGALLGDNTATLGPITAQRFGIAWPKKKRFAKSPSLLYQPTESKWIEHIEWGRAVLQPAQGSHFAHLALVSRTVEGDESKFMTIPAFAVRIPVAIENAELWTSLGSQQVDLRQIWQEEGEREAAISASFASVPLKMALPGEALFLPDELKGVTPFHELLEKRLRAGGVEANPGFAGSAVPVDDDYIKAQQDYRKNLSTPSATE